MKFHWPSFLLGYGAGAATVLMADRLRPLLTEIASAAYKLGDNAWERLTVLQENVEDTLAEARAKARAARLRNARHEPARTARPAPRKARAMASGKRRGGRARTPT